jgi:hypothetical protein
MNKHKIILILVAIFVALGAWGSWYSFSRYQKIAHNIACEQSTTLCAYEIIPPTLWEVIAGKTCDGLLCDNPSPNVSDCDQSATTTPCHQITDIQKTPPPPVQQAQEPITSFAFGPLSQIYTDKKSGFSFRYPNEISLVDRHEGCIYFVYSPGVKSLLFTIQTPTCSPDSKKTSFEGYRKDYEMDGMEDTKLSFRHLSSESVKTKSGIEGIYQKFSVSVKYNGQTTVLDRISRRYIFKLPQSGFVIFSMQENSPDSVYYLPLEQAIIGSLTFP